MPIKPAKVKPPVPARRRTGKVPLLTPAMGRAVTHAKRGYPDRLIASLAGVHPNVLRDWLRQGNTDAADENHTVECEFFLEYTQARAGNAASLLKRQDKHAVKDFRANQWLFSVLHPDLMPEPSALKVKVSAAPIDLSDLDEAELKRLAGIE